MHLNGLCWLQIRSVIGVYQCTIWQATSIPNNEFEKYKLIIWILKRVYIYAFEVVPVIETLY